MNRSPAEYYFKYLFSQPKSPTIESVKQSAEALDLQIGSPLYLQELRDKMNTRPRVYRPRSERHRKSDEWLEFHRVQEMWRKTKGALEAMDVLNDIRLREHVEALILSPLHFEHFAMDLPGWLSEWGFITFRHYFFNMTVLSSDEIKRMVISQGGIRKKAYFLDPDPVLARAVLNYDRGVDTFDVPMSVISKKLIDLAGYKLAQLSKTDICRDDALMVKRYSDTLETGQRLLSESGAAAEDLIEIFTQFSIGHGDEPEHVPSFEEVTGQPYIGEGTHAKQLKSAEGDRDPETSDVGASRKA